MSTGLPTFRTRTTPSFWTIGEEADDKNDYLIYDKESGAFSYDADGSKIKIKAIEFAKLDDHLNLKADDLLVV